MTYNNLPLFYLDANLEEEGINRISLVSQPANNTAFIAMGNEIKLAKNPANHTVYGLLVAPEAPIYRRDANGEEYYICFSKQAVENLAAKLIKEGNAVRVDTQHNQQEIGEGIYPVSIWLTNKEICQFKGFENIPDGSLMIQYKVVDEDLFNTITESFKGFSIEAVLSTEDPEKEKEEALALYNKIKNLR